MNRTADRLKRHVIPAETRRFYLDTMGALRQAGIGYLVGGAHALAYHVGIRRHTKDFDLFVRPGDVARVVETLNRGDICAHMVSPLWLGKAFRPGSEDFVDLIFGSGNGLCPVNDGWFERAVAGQALDEPAPIIAVEEMIWSKAFVQERERFDGADIAHLLLARAAALDWTHLLKLFERHEQVLLAHLVMFTYIYPSEREAIPRDVLESLMNRVRDQPAARSRSCRGTTLSRSQYLVDVSTWGFADGRLRPAGPLTPDQVEELTASINPDQSQWTWSDSPRPGASPKA